MNFITNSREQQAKQLKNIFDCKINDPIVSNLFVWAERLERWGKILFWLIIIAGTIWAFIVASQTFLRFLEEMLGVAFYAFIEYCGYHVLALLIGSLATIARSTTITAKLTEYRLLMEIEEEQPVKKEKKPVSAQTPPQAQEKKPEGNRKGDTAEAIPIPTELTGVIRCPKCGAKQKTDRDSCYYCGIKFKKISPKCETMLENDESVTTDNEGNLEETEIFCISCGKKIPSNGTFCIYCGAKVE